MKLTVLAFASYKQLLGFEEAELPLPDPPTLGELLKHPRFANMPKNALLVINHKFAGANETLNTGDVVAVMPPVSGG